MAFKGGLSFNLGDIIIPEEKEALVQKGYDEVEQVINNYNMGFITNNERYNQVIDIWTHVNSELSNILMKTISSDDGSGIRHRPSSKRYRQDPYGHRG